MSDEARELRLSEKIDSSEVTAYLKLACEGSAPYDEFVYQDRALIAAVYQKLWQDGSGEIVPPHGRLLVWMDKPIGMVASLLGTELRRARMAATLMLRRTGMLPYEAVERTHLAAQTLLSPGVTDYYLSRVAIDQPFRGRRVQGLSIGTRVLLILEREAREKGAENFVAEVSADLPRLVAFYQRFGFEVSNEAATRDPISKRALRYLHLAKPLLT